MNHIHTKLIRRLYFS